MDSPRAPGVNSSGQASHSLALALIVCAIACGCAGAAPREDLSSEPPVIELGPAPPPVVTAEPVVAREPDDGAACIADLVAGGPASAAPVPADEALFREALAAEARGESEGARKQLLELVERYMRSRFVPLAYLQFGEMFASEAASDPARGRLAQQFYREVLKYPQSPVFAYASLRAAELAQVMGEHSGALSDFKRAIEASAPESPCSAALSRRARDGLVISYAFAGDPAKAFVFFRPLSGDAGNTTTATFAMMLSLVEKLADARPADAAIVVEEIARRGPDGATCTALRATVAAQAVLRTRFASLLSRCGAP